MKKRIICFLLCAIIALSLAGCKNSAQVEQQSEEDVYKTNFEKKLNWMDVTLSENDIKNEEYNYRPWVTNRVQLPGSDMIISKEVLQIQLNRHELLSIYKPRNVEHINLTVQDIIDLYTTPNEAKQAEFDKFYNWYQGEDGSDYYDEYMGFAAVSYYLWKDKYGKPFNDKGLDMYTAEDYYALVKWGLENIDYEFVERTNNAYKKNPDDPNIEYRDIDYCRFLYHLGLIDESPTSTLTIIVPDM